MTIYNRLVRAESIAQTDNGGGRRTADEIESHIAGEWSEDLDRDDFHGRISLYKGFAWRDDLSAQPAAAVHAIVSAAANEPLVQTHLVAGGDEDQVSDIKAYLAQYLLPAGPANLWLYLDHSVGQRSLTMWQRLQDRQPSQGQALYLVADEGGPGEVSQIVRITIEEVEETMVNLGGACGDTDVRFITVSIGSPLRFDFPEVPITCTTPGTATIIRRTRVNDAVRVFGMSDLAAPLTAPVNELTVDTVYGQMIPASYANEGFTSQQALGSGNVTVSSGGQDFTVSAPVHTYELQITEQGRAYQYPIPMQPIPPASGVPQADVVILNDWFTIEEGTEPGVGSLQVDRQTGVAQLQLDNLPAADTSLLAQWPGVSQYVDRAGDVIPLGDLIIRGKLDVAPDIQIDRSTVTVTWTSGSTQRTATCSSAGVLSGDGSGFVSAKGEWWLSTALTPDGGTGIQIDFDPTPRYTENFPGSAPDAAGALSATLAGTPAPGSIDAYWLLTRKTRQTGYKVVEYTYTETVCT